MRISRFFRRFICIYLIYLFIHPVMCGFAEAQLLMNPFAPDRSPITASENKYVKTSGGASMAGSSEFILDPDALKEYRLGPNDLIDVHIIVGDNDMALDYTFLVSASGSIFFPNIGEIYLSKLSLEQAKAKLTDRIKASFDEEFKLSLSLKQPKQIKVYMTGQVRDQGPLVVWDCSRVSEVIKQAGGTLSGGSFRTIIIKRGGEELAADLYDAMGKGILEKDIRVHAGDVIEVPIAGSARVTVLGEVPRQGQYELKDGETLKDALMMAGYLGVNSVLTDVAYLKREKDKDVFEEYKLNLYENRDRALDTVLQDGDIITIPGIEAFIYVYGEVKEGGRIDYVPGKKLSDYLNYAGGPTPKALLRSVSVTRKENGKPKVYMINASDILYSGHTKNDIELKAGDVVNVPGNFFYFADFSSFANTVLLTLTLYSTLVR